MGITFVPKEAKLLARLYKTIINVWISRVPQLSGRQIDVCKNAVLTAA